MSSLSLSRAGNPIMAGELLDCIVRFHDIRRVQELNRCIFSLVGQSYRPLHIILVLQRFSEEEVNAVRQSLSLLLGQSGSPTLEIQNWCLSEPEDGRAVLLNTGLAAATGRYIGFLDYDDTLYPEAYELLIARLQESNCAIAFAAVRVVSADIYPQFIHVTRALNSHFHGENLIDLFRQNFCPLHSYVLDRKRINQEDFIFDTELNIEEDYDFLLRICATYLSDFKYIKTPVGDYYFKTDGSNTVGTDRTLRGQLRGYKRVRASIERRRKTTLLSSSVQQLLGFDPPQGRMTVREAIDKLSRGGKPTRQHTFVNLFRTNARP